MDGHSSFTKNIDSNPKTIYQFHRNIPSFQFNFPNPNKEKYMNIVAHGNNIMGHLHSYGFIFPLICIPIQQLTKHVNSTHLN